MKKLTLALLAAALLGTGVSFADNTPAAGGAPSTPASDTVKKPAKKHMKKAKKSKKTAKSAEKPAEQPK